MEAAELRALEVAAQAADENANPDQAEFEGEAIAGAGSNLAGELAVYLTMIVGIVSPALPSVKAIYSEQVISGLCEATAAVCNKHGWLQDGIGGKYAEEITLAALVIPLGMATHKAVAHDIERLKQQQAEAEQKKEKTVSES